MTCIPFFKVSQLFFKQLIGSVNSLIPPNHNFLVSGMNLKNENGHYQHGLLLYYAAFGDPEAFLRFGRSVAPNRLMKF